MQSFVGWRSVREPLLWQDAFRFADQGRTGDDKALIALECVLRQGSQMFPVPLVVRIKEGEIISRCEPNPGIAGEAAATIAFELLEYDRNTTGNFADLLDGVIC